MSEHRHKMPSAEKLAGLPIVGNLPKDEKEEKFLREICEYEFYNLEEPGTPVTFPYGATTHQHTFTFIHGGKYRVPRCIAKGRRNRRGPTPRTNRHLRRTQGQHRSP